MVKQVITLIIASVIIILAATYIKPILVYLLHGYDWLVHLLRQIFSSGSVGRTLNEAIPLFFIPLVLGGLISAVYWMFKRSQFAYFSHAVWSVWLVLVTLLVYRTGIW